MGVGGGGKKMSPPLEGVDFFWNNLLRSFNLGTKM